MVGLVRRKLKPPFATTVLANAGAFAEQALRHIGRNIEISSGTVTMLAPTVALEHARIAIRASAPFLLHTMIRL